MTNLFVKANNNDHFFVLFCCSILVYTSCQKEKEETSALKGLLSVNT